MDDKEFKKLFDTHVSIALALFRNLRPRAEANEWAVHAVHVAILKWDKSRGSLSTVVHNEALRYRQQFVRSRKKWNGFELTQTGKTKGRYKHPHELIRVTADKGEDSIRRTNDDGYIAVCHREIDPDLILDIKDSIKLLEQERPQLFGNKRLSKVIQGVLAGKSEREIAAELDITHALVSVVKRKAKKALKAKLEKLLEK